MVPIAQRSDREGEAGAAHKANFLNPTCLGEARGAQLPRGWVLWRVFLSVPTSGRDRIQSTTGAARAASWRARSRAGLRRVQPAEPWQGEGKPGRGQHQPTAGTGAPRGGAAGRGAVDEAPEATFRSQMPSLVPNEAYVTPGPPRPDLALPSADGRRKEGSGPQSTARSCRVTPECGVRRHSPK